MARTPEISLASSAEAVSVMKYFPKDATPGIPHVQLGLSYI